MDKKLIQLQELKQLFFENLDNADYAKNYAEALHDCLYEKLIEPEEAREEYEFIQTLFPRLYRIKDYIAETLKPWNKDDITEINESLKELEEYYRHNPENESIAESYAISLWLFNNHPEAGKREEIMASLSELLNAFPDNETINEKYNDVLDTQWNTLSFTKPGASAKKVTTLHQKNIETEEEAVSYAKTLALLSKQQDSLQSLELTISKLTNQLKTYPNNYAIGECYAEALYNLLTFQEDRAEAESILFELNELFHTLPSEKNAELLAQAIEDVTSFDGRYLSILNDLQYRYPQNNFLINTYGYVLSCVSANKTNPRDVRIAAKKDLQRLHEKHLDNDTLQEYYLDS